VILPALGYTLTFRVVEISSHHRNPGNRLVRHGAQPSLAIIEITGPAHGRDVSSSIIRDIARLAAGLFPIQVKRRLEWAPVANS
jgi:hypothetical protein